MASISVLAWDKVVKDVSRALPSAGNSTMNTNVAAEVVKKTILALSSNSSYMEQTYPFLLPSEIENTNVTRSIYDELSTPQDELQKVSESIRGILSGKSSSSNNNNIINTNNNMNNPRRSLKSIAPAGTSTARNNERQKLAFQRKKETILKREKEGIDKKALRAASSVTDAAWEIKREMQIEGNEAGYRSEATMKRLKATIASSALLEGGKNWIGKRLGSGSDSSSGTPQLGSGSDSSNVTPQFDGSTSVSSSGGNAMMVDNTFGETTAEQEPSEVINDAVIIEPEFTEPTFEYVEPTSTTFDQEVATVSGINNDDNVYQTDANAIDNNFINEINENELNAERLRLISILQLCLEQPDQTWLRPDLVSADKIYNEQNNNSEQQQSEPYYSSQKPMTGQPKAMSEPFFASANDIIEEDPWEKVITAMVSAKSELEVSTELNGIGTKMSNEEIVSELYNMQRIVDAITMSVEAAAGVDSANFLRTELLGDTQKMNFNNPDTTAATTVNLQQQYENEIPTERTSSDFEMTNNQVGTSFENEFTVETIPQNIESTSYSVNEGDDMYNYDTSDPLEAVVVTDVIQEENQFVPENPVTKPPEQILADVEFEVSKTNEIYDVSDSSSNDDVVVAEVELLTDDIEVETVKESNPMNSAAVSEEESDRVEGKENFIVTLTLRTLDVLFFITEKTFTVSVATFSADCNHHI